MRRRITALVAGLLAAASAPAHAQTNFSSAGNLITPQTVGYHFFQVTTAGQFDIFTTSITGPTGTTPFDPVIYLFSGLGTGGTFLAADDDSCGAQCGPAASFANALINDFNLAAGYYTVAVGDYQLSLADARDGFNEGASALGERSGRYLLNVTSGQGVARDVPEPSSLALLAAGLFGMGAVVRRRRAA